MGGAAKIELSIPAVELGETGLSLAAQRDTGEGRPVALILTGQGDVAGKTSAGLLTAIPLSDASGVLMYGDDGGEGDDARGDCFVTASGSTAAAVAGRRGDGHVDGLGGAMELKSRSRRISFAKLENSQPACSQYVMNDHLRNACLRNPPQAVTQTESNSLYTCGKVYPVGVLPT